MYFQYMLMSWCSGRTGRLFTVLARQRLERIRYPYYNNYRVSRPHNVWTPSPIDRLNHALIIIMHLLICDSCWFSQVVLEDGDSIITQRLCHRCSSLMGPWRTGPTRSGRPPRGPASRTMSTWCAICWPCTSVGNTPRSRL